VGRAFYYGKLTDYAEVADGGNKSFGSEFVFDLEVSYDTTDFLTLAVGVENIFDEYPDKNRRAIGTPNSNWYETTGTLINGSKYLDASPFGFNGGYWYVRANAKF
jgi:iron complex outermembrane receptor protein